MLTYDEIRPTLRTGDIVLFKGKHFRDKFLRLFCEYSHVSMIIIMPFDGCVNRVCTIEEQYPRAKFAALSVELTKHGEAFLIRSSLGTEQQEKISAYLFDKVAEAHPYDVLGLIQTGYKMMFGQKIKLNKKSAYCSALIGAALNHVGRIKITEAPLPDDIPKLLGRSVVPFSL